MKHKYTKSYEMSDEYCVVELDTRSEGIFKSQLIYYLRLSRGTLYKNYKPESLYEKFDFGTISKLFFIFNRFTYDWHFLVIKNNYDTHVYGADDRFKLLNSEIFPKYNYPVEMFKMITNGFSIDFFGNFLNGLCRNLHRMSDIYYYDYTEESKGKRNGSDEFFIIFERLYGYDELDTRLTDTVTYKSGKLRFM